MELQILVAIQSIANPILDVLMTALSWMGDQFAAVAVLTIVYWLWDKETGEYIAYSLLLSLSLNGTVKNLLRWPRPIGQLGIRSIQLESAPGYSFPSAHTQTAAALYGSLSWRLRRKAITIAALVLTALVGLSRMYLGLHWPRDVLAGYVLGLLASFGAYFLFCSVLDPKLRERAFLLTAAVFLIPAVLLAEESFVKSYGLLVGFAVAIPLEHRYVGFSTERLQGRRRVRRWIVGILILAVVKIGLGLLLPDVLPLMAVEYGVVAFTAFFICPWVFEFMHW